MRSRQWKAALIIFLVAFAVRILVWQNNKVDMATVQSVVTQNYLNDARAFAAGDLRTFISGQDPPSDANVLGHPPGYPILIGSVFAVFGAGDCFQIVQIAINSLAPVLIFLIGGLVWKGRTAVLAGALTALAPQFSYHAGIMLPDELSVVPLLLGVYLLLRALREPRWLFFALCGAALGVSCWFRANALLLPIFFALAILLWWGSRRGFALAVLVLASFLVFISPVTIRNAVVFGRFIPLSLGTGTTFVEGLGDIDITAELGLPKTDEDVMRLDEQLAQLPTGTFSGLYSPNGVERDRRRTRYGVSIVYAHPGWYAAGVVRRGLSTLRMERVPAIELSHDEKETTNPFLYYTNVPLKLIQRVFITALVLPLALLGIGISFVNDRRVGLVLVIVPLYYATVQAMIHTEYRYVLATPHILMIFAAAGLVFLVQRVTGIIRRANVASTAGAK